MKDLNVATVQFQSVPSDKAANLQLMTKFIDRAASQGVDLIAFPECCITGYWFLRNLSASKIREIAEPIPEGPSTARLLELARKHQITIGGGMLEAATDGNVYNSYVIAMPTGEVRCHRKLHAFEHEAISSGIDYTVFDTPYGCRVGVLICYDCNIIENVRITALMGAEILLAPHQTGGCRTTNPHLMGVIDRAIWDNRRTDPARIEQEILGDKGRAWLMRWLPSRAHDSGMFVVFSNGIGIDDDEVRTGNAMILDPYGRIIAESRKADEDMVVARLQGSLLDEATGRIWMQARRPDLYTPLTLKTGRERDARQLKFEE